jgi:hypothetical protein
MVLGVGQERCDDGQGSEAANILAPTSNVSYQRYDDISYSLWLTYLLSLKELSIGRSPPAALTLFDP